MSSKRRLKERLCRRKIRYPDWESAKAAAERRSLSDREMRCYYCEYCRGFHVGHSPGVRNGFRGKAWFIAGYHCV